MTTTAKEKTRRMTEYGIILRIRNSIIASYDYCKSACVY